MVPRRSRLDRIWNLPRPGTDYSGDSCEAAGDCGGNEICLAPVPCTNDLNCGEFGTCDGGTCTTANTCGVSGRDCLTGEIAGSQSSQPLTYCAAIDNTVIVQRDRDFGRAPAAP